MKHLWKMPSYAIVLSALEALDPTSAPGEDGIPALLYQLFPEQFTIRILQKIDHIARVGKWGYKWARGIMRSIPKEAGNIAVDKRRLITLFNAKAKWITGTIKLCSQDFIMMMVPPEQKGFMPGRNMDGHLFKVMEIQSQNQQGVWVSIDFMKAYDKVGHGMIEGLLRYVKMEEHWITMFVEFMKDELGFLVGNKISGTWFKPEGGIRQGDSLSPAIYVMVTAVLCILFKKELENVVTLLYADDTLLWIPGGMEQVTVQLRKVLCSNMQSTQDNK